MTCNKGVSDWIRGEHLDVHMEKRNNQTKQNNPNILKKSYERELAENTTTRKF